MRGRYELLFAAAAYSRRASRECLRGAGAAALASIASVLANAAGGLAVALVLVSALLTRRIVWLARARTQQSDALAAEMAASFAASNWQRRTDVRRHGRAHLRPALRVVL